MPSLSLLATGFPFLIQLGIAGKRDEPREAAYSALVAHQAIAIDLHAKQQRVVVAISGDRNNAQAIAAGLALHPQLLASAAPKSDEARLQRGGVTDRVEKTQHQHLASSGVLHDSGDQSIHFFEVDSRCLVAHLLPGSDLDFLRASKSPPALGAGGLWVSFDLSGRLHQAMAVRRHGFSMMMVMAVMAVALHLTETLREDMGRCQMAVLRQDGNRTRMMRCIERRDLRPGQWQPL